MIDKKPSDRGVVDSITALRIKRYNEKGPGAKRNRSDSLPTVDQLRGTLAKITKKKTKSKGKCR